MIKTTIFCLLASFVLFLGCKNSSKSVDTPIVYQMSDEEYIDQGQDISSSAFLALSGALRKAIKAGGLKNALSYCNVNALALTDSLSDVYDVEIKRTSLKHRNPKNRPTADEIEILNQEIQNRNDDLESQREEIARQKKLYLDQWLQIEQQQEDMNEHAAQLAILTSEVALRQDTLDSKTRLLEIQEAEISTQRKEILNRNQILVELEEIA